VGELDGVSRLNKNPHRQAGFRVLRAYDVPSVLVELGYLSSRKDFALLMSEDWRNRSTAAMTEAIDRFFAPRLAKQGAAPVSP
jgi:N-acetylmuramoyl-L-alanine amidase